MTTSVADLHVKYLRPRYSDLRDWLNDPNNIYVGREGRVFINSEVFAYKRSIWHNPFTSKKDGTLQEVIDKYFYYILEKIEKENLVEELKSLKGKCLGCWCVECLNETNYTNFRCHAQVLLYIINSYF